MSQKKFPKKKKALERVSATENAPKAPRRQRPTVGSKPDSHQLNKKVKRHKSGCTGGILGSEKGGNGEGGVKVATYPFRLSREKRKATRGCEGNALNGKGLKTANTGNQEQRHKTIEGKSRLQATGQSLVLLKNKIRVKKRMLEDSIKTSSDG